MECSNCGRKIEDNLKYCPECNTRIEKNDTTQTYLPLIETDTEDFLEIIPEVKGETVLVVKKGPNPGQHFILKKKETVLGRDPDANIFLDDITVSRKHAKITREKKSYFLIDTKSLNGTYLNGKRIENEKLKSYDEIQIGKFILIFVDQKK